MPKKRRKSKRYGLSEKCKEPRTCFECANCMYVCEGDHVCDVNMELITEDWNPTRMFYHCGGKEFIKR